MSNTSARRSQPVALRPIPVDKQPYLVRGTPRTVLYMTREHAARRSDLIPQFNQPPAQLPSPPSISIVFHYLFTQTSSGFQCRVPVRILDGPMLGRGVSPTMSDCGGVDLNDWAGRNLNVTIEAGIHLINGVAS